MEITTMAEALQLHAQILKSGGPTADTHREAFSKLFTFSALSPAGDLSHARLILRSHPSPNSYFFNTLLRAYSHSPNPSHPLEALSLFSSILEDPHPAPDKFTYPFLFKCCARLGLNRAGEQVHAQVVKSGLTSDLYVAHGLIHMYSACGESGHALEIFDRMLERDVVSWTCTIDGLVDNDHPVKAIEMFEKMLSEGFKVNDATVVSVLRACAESGSLSTGKRAHAIARERDFASRTNVRTALIDMYSKCGSLDDARSVFGETEDKDVFHWTAMMLGLASHGMCREALNLFDEMRRLRIGPDERTMTAVLSACRNAGWVDKGLMYFRNMRKKYGVQPTIQHHGCIVDMLARAGRLGEAEDFIWKMPIEPDAVMWRTLIWACKVHGDCQRSIRLMKQLKLQDKGHDDCSSYVLMQNIYAAEGKWQDKARIRELMSQNGLRKPPGSSKIEVDGSIHEFIAGDSSHPEAKKIYKKLDEIQQRLTEEGHVPKVSEVMLKIGSQFKTLQLWHHSEKLAVAYGLIRTNLGSEIRIVKNLRSCEDCHEVMKLLSKIYGREIIVRDRIRFHYFRNGECSCGDRW
ncbi:pentatricopeptide repeat-containing protein At4g21065-like [Punica granatum]|uniref:Pentatricopeptide repeat-containing protein At4g21065-like n=2 Tax=Punica granatum TaxID=22663 RepID=A0A6P8CEE0_PUNGR|nr:pentatricopeptide repeat-containing protein At4g21065-like [Punica granatum]